MLVVAFNSDIADASQQQQAVLTAGSPSPTSLLNAAQVFQGTVCVPGSTSNPFCVAAGSPVTPGVASSAQYQFGRMRFNDQTYSGFGAVLPFTLPISKDFKYASATQANLSIERQLTKDMSMSVSYLYVSAHNLPHPTDLNGPNTALQIRELPAICRSGIPGQPDNPDARRRRSFDSRRGRWHAVHECVRQYVRGCHRRHDLAQCPGGRVINPAIANFFRPNAPNYFLAAALSGGAVSKCSA